MEAFRVVGGAPLIGATHVSGAKNAALPILLTCLLTDAPCEYTNVPAVRDVDTMIRLLDNLGVSVERNGDAVRCTMVNTDNTVADYALVKTMRASVLALGPLLAARRRASISLPGGCAIGMRPIDMHLQAFRQMGATIAVDAGYVVAEAPDGLRGADITFMVPTVTGTENVLMAAVCANGRTVIENAAEEPEIVDLANCLLAMGAEISGAGSRRIIIDGVPNLRGVTHRVMFDRIETGTYLIAAAMTGGDVLITGVDDIETLRTVVDVLTAAGAVITQTAAGVRATASGRLRSVDIITAPFPGLPTDMQAQCMAMNAIADGTAVIRETIFENRFMHVAELNRLGARIITRGNTAVCTGVPTLHGAEVMATDLRASAGLVLATLVAEGESIIHRIYHIDRGYAAIDQKLRALGATIDRIHDDRAV